MAIQIKLRMLTLVFFGLYMSWRTRFIELNMVISEENINIQQCEKKKNENVKTLLADCLFIDWVLPINRHLINSNADATVPITL